MSVFFLCESAKALDASGVLVLYNEDSPESVEIAEYYTRYHPGVKLLGLEGVSTAEVVTQDHYLDVIRPQVLSGLTDSIEAIVTTKGLPLRIHNTSANPGTYPGWRGDYLGVVIDGSWWEPYSSLESELTRIDRVDSSAMMGDQAEFMSPPIFPYPTLHHAANPYFDSGQAFDRTDPGNEGIRLASRLDGFDVADVKAMIDRAQHAYTLPLQQNVVIDNDPDAPAAGVDRMQELGFNVLEPLEQNFIYEDTDAAVTDSNWPVIGYVSHGKHGAGRDYIDKLNFDIANGAVFHTWESYNAYSFQEGNNLWGQGLVGEWIQKGGTAALGNVHEPGASAATVTNEDIFWEMLLQGYTFAEAAWAATPQLSFVNTAVGDPLMTLRPWSLGDADMDGVVSVGDLAVLLTHWNQPSTGGVGVGDFNGDGYVGYKDLNILLTNWDYLPQSPAAVSVPEPAGSTVILVAVAGALRVRPLRAASAG